MPNGGWGHQDLGKVIFSPLLHYPPSCKSPLEVWHYCEPGQSKIFSHRHYSVPLHEECTVKNCLKSCLTAMKIFFFSGTVYSGWGRWQQRTLKDYKQICPLRNGRKQFRWISDMQGKESGGENRNCHLLSEKIRWDRKNSWRPLRQIFLSLCLSLISMLPRQMGTASWQWAWY